MNGNNTSLNIFNNLRRDSLAYDLSNDDFSADLAQALNDESSLGSSQHLDFDRKLSTMTFGPKNKNPNEIAQKRRRRK